MRYDLIDIEGTFKINGNTGFEGAALGFSGSNIDWIQNGAGSTQSLFNNSGYNYLIVGATGSPTENGQGLYDAYNFAVSNFDSPSVDNRFTILLLPGEYDLNVSGYIALSNYIDIVGISRNPYDTIIKNSSAGLLFRDTSGVDTGLSNIYLYGDSAVVFQVVGLYLRWTNLVIGGNTFDYSNKSVEINGEFKDIVILDGANFVISDGDIFGRYENIKGGNINYFFNAGANINIELKNVDIQSVSFPSLTSILADLMGNYENIKIGYSEYEVFSAVGGGSISGYFKDIKIISSNYNCFQSSSSLSGTYKDLYFGSISGVVFSSTTISGIFRNIKGNSVGSIFSGQSNIDLIGLDFNNMQTFLQGGINSIVRDVIIRNSLDSFNCSSNGQELRGTFSNLQIYSTTNCFYTNDSDMYVSLYNSNIKGGFMISGGSIYATLENVYVDPTSGCMESTFVNYCDLRNIVVGDVSNGILTSLLGGLISNVDNLICGNVNQSAIYGAAVSGNFHNLRFGNVGGQFVYSSAHLTANFYKVSVGDVGSSAFRSNTLFKDHSFRNIKIGNCGTASFYSPSFDTSSSGNAGYTGSFQNVFERIEVGDVNGDFFVARANTGRIRAFLKNIKVGNVNGDFIRTYYKDNISPKNNINGNFKNLKANVVFGSVFSTNPGDGTFELQAIGSVENLTVASCSDVFYSYMWIDVKVRNINVNGAWKSIHYRSSLENSTIDQTGRSGTLSLSSQSLVIKRSTLINGANPTPLVDPYFGGSAQVYLTGFNNVVSVPSGFTSANRNIINSNIISPD